MNFVKEVKKWVNEIYDNSDHLIRTSYWLKKLDSDVDLAVTIAAITHDIERAFPQNRKPPSPEWGGAKWDDEEYNLWHGRRSASFVEKFLREKEANKKLISKVKHLIVYHEIGGDRETELVRDADSISFLEINVPMFISMIPKRLTKREVKEKVDYMFKRISNREAKVLARPFYKKALTQLATL